MKGIITLIGKIQIYLMFHIFICFDDDDDVSAHSFIDYNTNKHEKLHCFYLDTYFKALNCPVLFTEVGMTIGYTFIHLLCAIYALNMDRVCTCMHDPCACQNIACKRDFITDPLGHPRFM